MKILLVRLRLIGDVVFTTPILRALRHRFPDAHLAYLVEPLAEPIVRRNPHLSSVITAPRARGLARVSADLTLAARLRRERFDVAIDLHGGPRAAWLTWASRAPMRIGYTIAGRTWMYTHVVRRAPDLTPRHSVLNQWDLLEPLGIDGCDPRRYPVEIADDPDTDRRVHRQLADNGIEAASPLVVLHVSAGNPFRRWPADSFATLIATLAQRDPARRFVIMSGPDETALAQQVADRAQALIAAPRKVVWSQVSAVEEVRPLVSRAAVYIGGDSGPLHIAATTATPVVALFGPTLAERSMPWRDGQWFAEAVDAGPRPCRPCHQRHCVSGDFRCLTNIAPERVAAAAERALAAGQADRPRARHA